MAYDLSARSQLRDTAEAQIRELIVAGLARPGQLLRLAPLAQSIGASVTPVREALLLLAQDGWVVQEPNRGFRVSALRRQDVADTYLVHAYVAGELAQRAARERTDEDIASLRILDAEIRSLDGRDGPHVENLNYELHDMIYAIAKSPRLTLFIRSASRFVPRRYWSTIPGWHEVNRRSHKPIIDAIAASDEVRAERRMSAHITKSGKLLMSHLDSIGFWAQDIEESVGAPEAAPPARVRTLKA